MTDSQKRVAIARDVIKQLKEELVGACHLYFIGDIDRIVACEHDPLADVRALIRKEKIKKDLCDVCAKGALLIAHILRFDRMNVGQFRKVESSIAYTSPIPYFTDEQFNLIEALYEERSLKVTERWRKFYDGIFGLENEARIVAIMKEIIRRRGRVL